MSREEIEGRVRNEIQREISHETWRGLRVESYRFKVPIPPELRGSEWDWGYCSHWSTHPGAEPLVSLFDATQAITALLAENERLREALAPFAEASRLAKIGGYPPFQFVGAGDYGNAEAALNKDPDQ